MKTLILYASHDGQTKKIAHYLAEMFEQVSVYSLYDDHAFSLENFDRIIIGASIRYGHFDKRLYQFIETHHSVLNQKSAVFFGVNLTARKAGKDTPQGNVYIRKFLQKIKWQPNKVGVFAGALRYPLYNLFDKTMIRFIMLLTGGETNPNTNIEYTDWEKVRAFGNDIKTP